MLLIKYQSVVKVMWYSKYICNILLYVACDSSVCKLLDSLFSF